MTMKRKLGFVILAGIVSGYAALGQTTVRADQGRPGNQGPWPVTITGAIVPIPASSSGPDGGAVVVQPLPCSGTGTPQKITTTGVAAVNTPSAQKAGRVYIVLCNSLQNTGTPLVKCRMDGTAPVMAAGNLGDVFGIGDCIRYDIQANVVPQCIADAATTYVTSYECP